MTLHGKSFEPQDTVSLKYDGKIEYGVILEVLAPGCRPMQKTGFTALPGMRYHGTSAVIRIDLKNGMTACDWRETKDLTPVHTEYTPRRPVC